MLSRFFPIAVIVTIMIVGYCSRRKYICDIERRINDTTDYHNKFIELVNTFLSTKKVNSSLYIELTQDVNKMQRELGQDGIMVSMHDPLRGIRTSNYQMLINFLPEINNSNDLWDVFGCPNSLAMNRFMQLANNCVDSFLRHNGSLRELLEEENNKQRNPFSSLAEGVCAVLWIPFYILASLGFFSENGFASWRTNWFSKFVSASVALIGLISSIVTILIGWDEFLQLISTWRR